MTTFWLSPRAYSSGSVRASGDIKVYLTPWPAPQMTSEQPCQYQIHNPYASLKKHTRPEMSVTYQTARTWTTPKFAPNTTPSVKATVRNPYIKSPHGHLMTSTSTDCMPGVNSNVHVSVLHRDGEYYIIFLGVFAFMLLLLTVSSKICYIYNRTRPPIKKIMTFNLV